MDNKIKSEDVQSVGSLDTLFENLKKQVGELESSKAQLQELREKLHGAKKDQEELHQKVLLVFEEARTEKEKIQDKVDNLIFIS